MRFREKLGKEMLLFDGAMGTQLQAKGLKAGELPEIWNLTHREIVRDIHRAYVHAGCDILKANTFGANALKFEGTPYTVSEIVQAAVENARIYSTSKRWATFTKSKQQCLPPRKTPICP